MRNSVAVSIPASAARNLEDLGLRVLEPRTLETFISKSTFTWILGIFQNLLILWEKFVTVAVYWPMLFHSCIYCPYYSRTILISPRYNQPQCVSFSWCAQWKMSKTSKFNEIQLSVESFTISWLSSLILRASDSVVFSDNYGIPFTYLLRKISHLAESLLCLL